MIDDAPLFFNSTSFWEDEGGAHSIDMHISPNLHIESIAPGTGVRYTATIKADKRLKDGQAILRVAVAHHQHEQESQTQQFTLQTYRR